MHKSDCAVHNAPALPPATCDCGAVMSMYHTMDEMPKMGTRIIVLPRDGSGAYMYFVADGFGEGTEFLNHDGDAYDPADIIGNHGDYAAWAYLPEDFRLWYETAAAS